MKTAIYIEQGIVQLVLTPENDWEKRALGAFHEKPVTAKFYNGSFYSCQGGWMRHQEHYPVTPNDHADDASLMIRVDVAPTP